jgi:SLT domain-containing protein
MFTSNLTQEFQETVNALTDSTHAVYGSHSYSSGYFGSQVVQMFEMLSKKQKQNLIDSVGKTKDMYVKRALELAEAR